MTDRDPGTGTGPDGGSDPPHESPWPVELRGVTESVVATLGPNDRWNLAALGLYAPGRSPDGDGRDAPDDRSPDEGGGDPRQNVTARTWGRTRTRRNFRNRGGGYVQFLRDPVVFVDAALGIREREEPVHPAADAWVRVTVERLGDGREGDTEWVDWRLSPRQAGVESAPVVPVNRGFGAVVEASVVASRLDVEAYDTATGVERLSRLDEVVERCGGERERTAFERIDHHVDWRSRTD